MAGKVTASLHTRVLFSHTFASKQRPDAQICILTSILTPHHIHNKKANLF